MAPQNKRVQLRSIHDTAARIDVVIGTVPASDALQS